MYLECKIIDACTYFHTTWFAKDVDNKEGNNGCTIEEIGVFIFIKRIGPTFMIFFNRPGA